MLRTWLFILWFLLSAKSYSQSISVIQINAEWNERNSIDLSKLRNAKVSFGYLGEQPESLKNQIKAVPTIMIFKDGKLIHYWNADLSFKLKIRQEEIQDYINSIQ